MRPYLALPFLGAPPMNVIIYFPFGMVRALRGKNMPTFKCADIGMKCGFEAKAQTKEEILLLVGMHANAVHDMKSVPPDLLKAINKAIKA